MDKGRPSKVYYTGFAVYTSRGNDIREEDYPTPVLKAIPTKISDYASLFRPDLPLNAEREVEHGPSAPVTVDQHTVNKSDESIKQKNS